MSMSDWQIVMCVTIAVSFGLWKKSFWAAAFLGTAMTLLATIVTRTAW